MLRAYLEKNSTLCKDERIGFLGLLFKFKYLLTTNDAYHEYRLDVMRRSGLNFVSQVALKTILIVGEVNVAKVLLGLPPVTVHKLSSK